jgi:adenine-specific DNA-methyltransferase
MRYLGTKSKLLPYLKEIIFSFTNLKGNVVFCDMFAGTGAVGDFFQNSFKIISNDNLYFSYLLNRGKLTPPKQLKFPKLDVDPFTFFNTYDASGFISGYCYNNFAPSISKRMYFSDDNSKKIDFIRETIDTWFAQKKIDSEEKDYLLACLLESISKVSNVAGVYSAHLRHWDSRALKDMKFIPVESINKPKFSNIVFSEDCRELIHKISGDILYLDPPYTATQYISQYHLLETIARNDHPITHGVGAHRDNGNQISLWSKKHFVASELDFILSKANFKYIVLSYSDNGLLSKEVIENILKRYAQKGKYEFKQIDFVKYKSSRAVNREQKNNTGDKTHFEWLFLIEKSQKPLFNSPLNYIGGKFNLLDEILPVFPEKINTFYDLFGGGGSISINATAKKVIYNDINFNVQRLLKYIADSNSAEMIVYIKKIIKKYQLDKANRIQYNQFRSYYNTKHVDQRHPLDLLILISYGFEHQIRFNSRLEFNNPSGNSSFNDEMAEKLISFSNQAKLKEIEFFSKDYLFFEERIQKEDFVYCDPPYLLTRGAYNDGKRGFKGWNLELQNELLSFLTRIDKKGVKFALSSILSRDNKTNEELRKWISKNNYKVITLKKKVRRNRQDRVEVLILNY